MEEFNEVQRKWAKIYATHQLTATYIESLEQDVEVLHRALNNILALFVAYNGFDYTTVDAGLKALARNQGQLPITMALAEKIERESNGRMGDDERAGRGIS